MGKRRTHDEFVQEMKIQHPNIEVLGVYKNTKTKIECKCKICESIFWSRPDNMLAQNYDCPKCRYKKLGKKLSKKFTKGHKKFEKEYRQKFPDRNYIIFLTQYKNEKEKILCYSFLDNDYWWMRPEDLNKGKENPFTRYERARMANAKTHEDYKAECLLLGFEPIEKYYNGQTPIMHRCLDCGAEFLAIPGNVLRGHTGCYKCRQSVTSYERRVMDILDKHNYGNKFQWSQKVYDNNRRYDFYLPEYNVAIEVDGEQHYKPVRFNGISQERAETNYIEQQRIDAEKTRWCIENNIKLMRIPYYWSAEETEEYILNYLKEADYYGKEES